MANLAALTAEESKSILDYYGFKVDGFDLSDDREATVMLGTAMASLSEEERQQVVAIVEALVQRKKYARD